MKNQIVFVFWGIACACLVSAANVYQSYPADPVKLGREEFIKIKDAAQAESMVDYIFGTDCYSKAVKSLEKGCKLMTPEEHSTLAFLLTKCFLDNSGRKTMRCSNKDHIRECTSNMDEDSFATYQHFFINIYNICIFLENDNFQKQTENLVQQLYKSTDDMFNKMEDMKFKIESQEDQLRGISSQALEITKMQALVEQGVSKGIEEVINLQISTATLEQQMNTSIQFETMLYDRQLQLMDGHIKHEELEKSRAQRVELHFQIFEEFQSRMTEWQQKYQELQDHLLASSETLMSRSNELQQTLIKLLDYEAKTEKAIRQVLGKSFRFYDLLLYFVGMVVGLCLGNMKKTQSAGWPVFTIFLTGLLVHRFLCDTWNQISHSEAGWLSSTLIYLGGEFKVGFIIQCCCFLSSCYIIYKSQREDEPENTVSVDADALLGLTKQLKNTERHLRGLADGQKKMGEYLKRRFDAGGEIDSGTSSAYRFASSNSTFQTAFQRHVCSLASPVNYKSKPKFDSDSAKKSCN